MKNWKSFFDEAKDWVFQAARFPNAAPSIGNLDTTYQAFKARLIQEGFVVTQKKATDLNNLLTGERLLLDAQDEDGEDCFITVVFREFHGGHAVVQHVETGFIETLNELDGLSLL